MNKVQIIADSKNEHGQRLITAILTFPRYLLAEVNTHRMLSRNSASSRAIRFEKMVQSVQENPFIPFRWQKDHPGMQGTEYFTDSEVALHRLKDNWLEARDYAVKVATHLNVEDGVTKQLCNRLLEPFMYHTALVSGTELENFFALRAQDAAEIHFQDLAYKFLEAANTSDPKQLKAGQWHIPFGGQIFEDELAYALGKINYAPISIIKGVDYMTHAEIAIATVRAARISYATPGSEMKHDYEADLKLHDRLASSGHWSAFEHCARAMSYDEYRAHISGKLDLHDDEDDLGFSFSENIRGWCGNFRGFIQYRKMFSDENRRDSRLIQK